MCRLITVCHDLVVSEVEGLPDGDTEQGRQLQLQGGWAQNIRARRPPDPVRIVVGIGANALVAASPQVVLENADPLAAPP